LDEAQRDFLQRDAFRPDATQRLQNVLFYTREKERAAGAREALVTFDQRIERGAIQAVAIFKAQDSDSRCARHRQSCDLGKR
jgi:hypothetical protein